MNRFILAKRHHLLDLDDGHALSLPTGEVHLDATLLLVVEGQVFKALWVKPPAELTINAVEEIAVERGRDALGVVIGREEDRGRFFQVDAQEKDVLRPQNSGRAPQELDALCSREVPQTGPEKGHSFLLQLERLNDLRLPREIGMHGMDLNVAVFLQKSVGRVPQDFSRNVYRTIAKRLPRPFISRKEVTGLRRTPAAELHQRQVADLSVYLRSIRAENLPFRPVWIVLGQGTDLLIQVGATLVIKVLRRQPFLWGGKAISHVLRKDVLVRLYTHIIELESLVGKCLGPH